MTPSHPNQAIKLSVVFANYNHAAFLPEAVGAAAGQIPAPDEIIVVDDASTDNSREILDGLRREHPQLRVIALPQNRGAIFALNKGLAEARGACIYFGAADDVTKPGLFHAMLRLLDRHPEAAFACCEGEVLDVDTGKIGMRPPVRPAYGETFFTPGEVADCFKRIDNWILTGTTVMRRELIANAGGFDAALGALADGYALRRLALMHGCCFAPFTGLVWRISRHGLSRSQAADPTAILRTLAVARERMLGDPAFPDWYPAVFERRWRFAVSRIAAIEQPMNRPVLAQIGARGPIGRLVLKTAAALGGPLGRLAALGWLSLQERPTSLGGLAATWLSRSRLS